MALRRALTHANGSLRSFLTDSAGVRSVHTSAPRLGRDSREKRSGHVPKKDNVDGETGPVVASSQSYEFIDENIMDRVINGMKFSDIPILYMRCTRNNTKIKLLQGDGTEIVYKTAGSEGFKHCRKGTTVAAQAVANRMLMMASDNEIDTVRLVFNGLGPGRNAAYKVFELSDLNVVSLTDWTRAAEPWNYRPRKAKRI